MKQSQEVVNARRQAIIDKIQAQPNLMMTVQDLATLINVSQMTIRRDLTELELMGKVTRIHGKAKILEAPEREGDTKNTHIEAIKQKIAQKASDFVQDGMTIFINSSSTALKTLDFLTNKPLVIITNNAHVIDAPFHPNSSVILSGGEVRFPKEALVGDLTLSAINNVQANVCILGCSGISAERGVSTINIHEAAVNEAMIHNTNNIVIVLADYRKIGTDANFFVSPVNNIDILITDSYAPQKTLEQFESMGVQVIQVMV